MIKQRQGILKVSYCCIDEQDYSYRGQCAFEKPHGSGNMHYRNSDDYYGFDGHWIGGKFYDGTLVYKNGDSFKGLFRDGRRHKGTITFSNEGGNLERKETRSQKLSKQIQGSIKFKSDMIQTQFTGTWHDDRNSEGTLVYESGSKYVGQLKSNKRYGKGVYTYPNLEE